jgi:hypothetical protein
MLMKRCTGALGDLECLANTFGKTVSSVSLGFRLFGTTFTLIPGGSRRSETCRLGRAVVGAWIGTIVYSCRVFPTPLPLSAQPQPTHGMLVPDRLVVIIVVTMVVVVIAPLRRATEIAGRVQRQCLISYKATYRVVVVVAWTFESK